MENIKQKRLIIFKTVLLTMVSACAGIYFYQNFEAGLDNSNFLNNLTHFISYWDIHAIERVKNTEYFVNSIPQYFFLFMFLVLSQWILFSERLPQNWLFASLLGAILASLLESTSRHLLFIPKDPLMELLFDFLNGCFLVGFLATIPQWLLLRKRWEIRSYYWLVVNSIGWGIVGFFLHQELAISYTFGFGEVRVMFFEWIRYYRLWYIIDFCSFIPLGLGIGLFFAQSEMKEKLEDVNIFN